MSHPFHLRHMPVFQFILSDLKHWQDSGTMKNLIYCIAQSLVNHPEMVTVTQTEGSDVSIIELKVAKEDVGKIIGKQGRTATAIRTILAAAAARSNRRTILEIIE